MGRRGGAGHIYIYIYIYICLSLLFLFFISSFLSLFFAFFWFLVLFSFFPCLYPLDLFHKRNNMQVLKYKVVSHQSFPLFFGFLSCFLFQIPVSYLCFFPDFKFCFCSAIDVFGFKTNKHQNTHTHKILVKRGVATKHFSYEPVFCKT